MRLFDEEVDVTLTNSNCNYITVKSYEEVFFDVYEIEFRGKKYIAEKVGTYGGHPVVSIPVSENNQTQAAEFVLKRGNKSEVLFNRNTPTIEKEPSFDYNVPDTLVIETVEEESTVDEIEEVLKEHEQADKIREGILKAKESGAKFAATAYADKIVKEKVRHLEGVIDSKYADLQEYVENSKEVLLEDFVKLVNLAKESIGSSNQRDRKDIENSVKTQLSECIIALESSLTEKQEEAIIKFDEKLTEIANNVLNEVLLPEVANRESKIRESLAIDVDQKLNDLHESFNAELVSTKSGISVLEKTNVEITDSLKKASSKIDRVEKSLSAKLQETSKNLQSLVESEAAKVSEYYDRKIELIESDISNKLTAADKEEIVALVESSKQSIITELANTQREIPNIIIERANGSQEIDVDKLQSEVEKSISSKVTNQFTVEIQSLKRLVEMSSGGGSVAMQFANGGTMNGNLTVIGAISASQYLGLSIPSGEYLPLSGGNVTGDVSVSGLLSANRIQMNTTAGLPASEGQLTWNDQDGTLNIGLKGSNVTLQVGQEQVARVVNKTGANLFESEYRAVRIRSTAEGGTQGQRLAVVLAQANNDPNSVDTLGLVTEDIAVNQEGYVTTSGLVRNINTTGTLQGETWADGDVLYLSPTTAGRLTNIKPQAPNHTVIMGFVVYKHQNQGTIYVKVDNGYEINELHNVKIDNLSGGDVLTYDSVQSVWKNTNTLKINSLSAERIFTTQLDALSANITVVDIKQYELSGFNVTGDVTINGSVSAQSISSPVISSQSVVTNSVSAQSISAGNIFSNGNRVATVVDPTRTTLTGNGILSSFAIAGAGSLTNPSALIVAIDGALQEPSVDYTVANGNITFTDPLANGAKAVVIAPTNTLQVSNMIPSDGSVTSAKLAPNLTLTNASFGGAAQFTGTSRPTSAAVGSPAATDLITRNDLSSLFDTFRLSRSFIEVKNMAQPFTGGSGQALIAASGSTPEQQRYSTGTTTGSFAGANSGGNTNSPHPCPVAGINPTAINWGLRQRIFWKLSVRNFAGCDCRFYWGGAGNTIGTGDSTVRCVGIKITGSSLFLQAHNGTTMTTSAALLTITNDIVYDIWVDCDGLGNASLYNGDTLLGTIGGLATNIQNFNGLFIDRADNNATTSNVLMFVHKRAILTGNLY